MGVQAHGAMTWLVESNPVDCVCIVQPIFLSRIWCLFCLNSPRGYTDWPIRIIIPQDDVASSVGSCHTVPTHTHTLIELEQIYLPQKLRSFWATKTATVSSLASILLYYVCTHQQWESHSQAITPYSTCTHASSLRARPLHAEEVWLWD